MNDSETWDETNYFSTAAATGDRQAYIDIDQTTDAAFYNPTNEEKRYNALQDKYYDLRGELRVEQDKLWKMKVKLGEAIADMSYRNKALNEVVRGVFAQIRFNPNIYEKIIETIDNYEGSYAVGFIIEDILRTVNDKAKDIIVSSTSRRRINIPVDSKVTIKKINKEPILTLNRITNPQ